MTQEGGNQRLVFLVRTRPKSLQSKGKKEEYQQRFVKAARPLISNEPHFSAPRLYLRVVYLFREDIRIDVDNILKPIADGLRLVVYSDDGRIVKCAAEKVDLQGPEYELVDDTLPSGQFQELLAAISDQTPHCLLVEIGEMADKRVAFGPIDAPKVVE